jgi:hypothetical protein
MLFDFMFMDTLSFGQIAAHAVSGDPVTVDLSETTDWATLGISTHR